MLPTSSVVWRTQSLMRQRWYLLVTAAAADEIASSSKLLWKFLLRVIALSMCSSNVVFCYSAQSFLEQYKRGGGGGSWRKPSLSVSCMFLSVGIINNNFFYNYDYPITGLQTQSILSSSIFCIQRKLRIISVELDQTRVLVDYLFLSLCISHLQNTRSDPCFSSISSSRPSFLNVSGSLNILKQAACHIISLPL